jgi:hypothetical protein
MEKILILRGQNALGKQKIQFLLQSSSNVNINTVCVPRRLFFAAQQRIAIT